MPVDKQDGDKKSQLLAPKAGTKVKYLNFAIIRYFLTDISHADRDTIYMKHIKYDFIFCFLLLSLLLFYVLLYVTLCPF